MTIAYLVGSDVDDSIERDRDRGVHTRGNTDFFKLRTRDPAGFARLHVTPDYFRQSVRYDLARFGLLVNLVTDPDQNPKVLANLVRLVKGYGGRIVQSDRTSCSERRATGSRAPARRFRAWSRRAR